jgi:DNA-binding transcriptional LysR family regulator
LGTTRFYGKPANCRNVSGTWTIQLSRMEKGVDTLLNIKAFLTTARAGSFSAAARELGVAPSVIVKRINRLEDQMRAQLFLRSTRKLTLTETGERYFPRYQSIVGEVEDAINGAASSAQQLEGLLRVKCPTTLAILNFGAILSDFQVAHPGITVELALIDRSVNPVEEDFDIAIGAMPASYANVIDEPLSPYPRVLCASPSYLEARGEPKHPIDLIGHDCLTFHVVVRESARAHQRRRAFALFRQRQPDPARRSVPRPRHRDGRPLHRPPRDRERATENPAAGLSGAGVLAEGPDPHQQDPPHRGAGPAAVDQGADGAPSLVGCLRQDGATYEGRPKNAHVPACGPVRNA